MLTELRVKIPLSLEEFRVGSLYAHHHYRESSRRDGKVITSLWLLGVWVPRIFWPPLDLRLR